MKDSNRAVNANWNKTSVPAIGMPYGNEAWFHKLGGEKSVKGYFCCMLMTDKLC